MDALLFAASSMLVCTLLRVAERRNSNMGQSPSKNASKAAAAPPLLLLQAAMEGDLAQIQTLVSNYENQQQQQQCHDNPSNVAAFLNEATDEASGKNTAMHGAIFAGHLEIVQYLYEQAGVESLTRKNGLGCTPLWLAAGYNRLEILDYVLQHLPSNVLSEALQTTNSTGDTPLLAAASKGHVEICQRLLFVAENANHPDARLSETLIQTTNHNRDSPLSVAIAAKIQNEALLNRFASDASIRNLPNAKGITPLLVACETDHLRAAQILLEANKSEAAPTLLPTSTGSGSGNGNVSVSSGDSPLGVAAFCGSDLVLKLLLSNDCHHPKDVDSSSPWSMNYTHPQTGCTPLFLAVRAGHVECARWLLEAGADVSIANRQGLTPRQVAEKYPASPAMLDLLRP